MTTGKILINDCLKMGDNELSKISDDTIRQMSYGIKYFDFGAAGISPTQRDWDVIEILRTRLQALETATPAKITRTDYIKCDCGHAVPRDLVMNSSSGTCCPECYDEMSW